MKKFILILFLPVFTFAFSQNTKTFVFADWDKQTYVIYVNGQDESERQIIKFDHLFWHNSIPTTVDCNNGKALVIRLLELGALYITNPDSASNAEKKAELIGKTHRRGYWKDKDPMISDIAPNNKGNKEDSISANSKASRKQLDDQIVSNNIYQKESKQHSVGLKYLSRIVTYTYLNTSLKEQLIFFRGDKFGNIIKVPIDNLRIDYALVQMLRCDTIKNYKVHLLEIGAASLKNMSPEISSHNERRGQTQAQKYQNGVWRNYYSEDDGAKPKNISAYIIFPYPPESNDFKNLKLPLRKRVILELYRRWNKLSVFQKIIWYAAFLMTLAFFIYQIAVFFLNKIYKAKGQRDVNSINNRKLEIILTIALSIAGLMITILLTRFKL